MAFCYPENYTADSSGTAVVRLQAERRLAAGFAVLDGALKDAPYVVGQRYSACDAYLFMLCTWAQRLSTTPSELPGLRRALDAVASRPAVERAYAAEGLDNFRY